VYIRGELLYAINSLNDCIAQLSTRRHLRGSEPVVAHHALLIWISYLSSLKERHRIERGLDLPLHALKVLVVKIQPTKVKREP
jgi:hypothetical protein